jgi:hypothetical protein
MQNNKLLYFVIASFLLMVGFRQACARIYRAEISKAQTNEELSQVQKHSETYFTMTDAVGEEALKTILANEHQHHEHQHHEHHAHEHHEHHAHEHHEHQAGCCDEGGAHVHEPSKPCVCKASIDATAQILNEDDAQEAHHHHHHHEDSEAKDPSVSPGLAILLKQLGFAELAANLLWVQMDADSHREMWHRVDFALDMIPLLDPTFIEAYLLKSFFLDVYRKQHKEALALLERAVKQVDNRIELWQQIGVLSLNHRGKHGDERNLARALEAFSIMRRFRDYPENTVRLIAVTLAAMERREEAIQIIEESMKSELKDEKQLSLDLGMIERIRAGEKF